VALPCGKSNLPFTESDLVDEVRTVLTILGSTDIIRKMRPRSIELESSVPVGMTATNLKGERVKEVFKVERIMVFPRKGGRNAIRVGGQTTGGWSGSISINHEQAKQILEATKREG
jgi:hypothetical protein